MSRLQKTAAGLLALALAAAYLWLCAGIYLAKSAVNSGNIVQLRRAVAISPRDADAHMALGRQLWLEGHDVNAAIAEYRAATAINPYPADYWIESAASYSVAGDNAGRDAAIERAERAAPFDTAVLWDVANLNLMRGDTVHGLNQMRTVVDNGGMSLTRYIELCWKVTGNVDLILREALPRSAAAYQELLNVMVYLGRADDAETVWNAAQSQHLTLASRDALSYIDFLLNNDRSATAARDWKQFTASGSEYARYGSSEQNLMVNPRFDYPILNKGLDWRYTPVPNASVTIDPHGGRSSAAVAIQLDGTATESGLYQLVPVTPGASYRISAQIKPEITGIDGPRLAVIDPATNQHIFLSEAVRGDGGWREVGGEFQVPAGTSLVAVRIIRWPYQTQIRGKLWLTDVSLRPLPARMPS